MPQLIKETKDERWYLYNIYNVGDERYIRVRRYKLNGKWKRISDKWYKYPEEEIWYTADFDIRDDYG